MLKIFFQDFFFHGKFISLCFYRLYTERRSACETAIEMLFHHFNRSEPTHKLEHIKLLDVIAACNQT